jgi:hypothetical protein
MSQYTHTVPFTTDELPVKYVHLQSPKVDDRGNKDFKITLTYNADKDSKDIARSFAKLVDFILQSKNGYVRPKSITGILEEAIKERVTYKIGNEYRVEASQRTEISYVDKAGNSKKTNFPIPVFNFLDDQIPFEDIPQVDDSYDTKANVTMKVKTQTSTGRLFLDLVSVKLTDFQPYVKDKVADENINKNIIDDTFGDIELEESNEFVDFDDEIPF